MNTDSQKHNRLSWLRITIAAAISIALLFTSVPVTANLFPAAENSHSVYAAKKTKTYKVTFKTNGGTVDVKSKKVKKGKKIGKLPKPYRYGYVYLGWYTKKSAGTKIKSSTKVKKNMTVYAQWAKENPVITFDPNGGKLNNDYDKTKTVTYKSAYGDLPAAKYSGYDFLGWYTAKSGGSLIAPTSTVKVKKDTTLYSHWKLKPAVKLSEMDYFSSEGYWYRETATFDNTNTLRSSWSAQVGGAYPSQAVITFLLNGQYKTMNGIIALDYNSRSDDSEYLVSIYLDGNLKYQNTDNYLKAGVLPLPTNLDVKNVQQIKFDIKLVRGYDHGSIIVDETFTR